MPTIPVVLLFLVWLAWAASVLGRFHWLCDLASHCLLQIWIGSVVIAFWLLLLRRWRWMTAAFFTACILGIATPFPLFIKVPQDSSQTLPSAKMLRQSLRIVSSNVLTHNRKKKIALDFYRESQADLLLLMEVDNEWLAATDALDDLYPYRCGEASEDNFGILLLSRYPFSSSSIEHFDDSRVASIVAICDIAGRSLRVVGTHPLPPMSRRASNFRNQHLENLATFIRQDSIPTIVMGDLNCTGWSYFYHRFVKKSGLLDSRQGFGVQPSWPAAMPVSFLRIPIDHLLTTAEIRTELRTIGPNIGSDHFPIMADLSW